MIQRPCQPALTDLTGRRPWVILDPPTRAIGSAQLSLSTTESGPSACICNTPTTTRWLQGWGWAAAQPIAHHARTHACRKTCVPTAIREMVISSEWMDRHPLDCLPVVSIGRVLLDGLWRWRFCHHHSQRFSPPSVHPSIHPTVRLSAPAYLHPHPHPLSTVYVHYRPTTLCTQKLQLIHLIH